MISNWLEPFALLVYLQIISSLWGLTASFISLVIPSRQLERADTAPDNRPGYSRQLERAYTAPDNRPGYSRQLERAYTAPITDRDPLGN